MHRVSSIENPESSIEQLRIEYQHLSKESTTVFITFALPAWIQRVIVFFLLRYRRRRYGFAFRRIPLTQGKFAIVDPDDFERLVRYKWHARKCNRTFYAVRTAYNEKNGKRKTIRMHREVLKVPEDMFVDHINHNGLNNRKANLRPATQRQNMFNRRGKTTGNSKYKGVRWNKRDKVWFAQIYNYGKVIHLGTFDNEIAAARAYDAAARRYHGEFSCLNFPAR